MTRHTVEAMVKPRRKTVVYTLLAALVLGHAWSVFRARDVWPFSHYPMYSQVYTDRWSELELYAVTDGETQREVRLSFREFPKPISAKVSLDHLLRKWQRGEFPREELEQAVQHLASRLAPRTVGEGAEDRRGIERVRCYRVTRAASRTGKGRVGIDVVERDLLLEVSLPPASVGTPASESKTAAGGSA